MRQINCTIKIPSLESVTKENSKEEIEHLFIPAIQTSLYNFTSF